MWEREQLHWKDNRLFRHGNKTSIAEIIQDERYAVMWCVRKLDGALTDMVNRTRAKDAAEAMVLRDLNSRKTPLEGTPVRKSRSALSR